MLKNGIIRPSIFPWCSPMWVVPKELDASGKRKWRVVVDYRKLNYKRITDRYSIPNITDILDKLGRSYYFSTSDPASEFHQIEMAPESISKTAFNTEHGHYEFPRMPFGFKNAPSTFQRMIKNFLWGQQNYLIYLDHIIFSTSLEKYIKNLKKIFQTQNLKIQLEKSKFFKKLNNPWIHVMLRILQNPII